MKTNVIAITIAGDTEMIPITPNAVSAASPRFPLGQVVMTRNAAARLDWQALKDGLCRHAAGDWGDLDPEDVRTNEDALKHGDRLLSAYGQGDRRFWIITEWDRSVTTILLPEDY
jgi:hypothetical protein